VEIPESGPFTDLVWSDPDNGRGWRFNYPRGAGQLFGKPETMKFTRINRLTFIARAHQLAQTGHAEYFGSPDEGRGYRLITVWSAPNYHYESGNEAAVLGLRITGEEDTQKIITFGPAPAPIRIVPPLEEMPARAQYFT
jgi:hypothetical protein